MNPTIAAAYCLRENMQAMARGRDRTKQFAAFYNQKYPTRQGFLRTTVYSS